MTRFQNSFGISFLLHVLLFAAFMNMGNWNFPAPKLALDFGVLTEKTTDKTPMPVFSKQKPITPPPNIPQPKIEQPKIEQPKIEEKLAPPPKPREIIPEPIPKTPPPPPKIEVKPRLPPETLEEKPLEITKKRELQIEDTKLDKIETKRRIIEETRLDALNKQVTRKMEEVEGLKQLGSAKHRTFEEPNVVPRIQTVQSRSANDVTINLPTAFASANSSKRRTDDTSSSVPSMPSSGGARQRQDDALSRTNLKAASSARRNLSPTISEDSHLKIGITSRSATIADTEKINLNVDIPKRETLVEKEPLKIPASQPKAETKGISRSDDEFQGTWQRIDNIGPLAHLNAKCYDKANGSIVVAGHYKFKCSKNQIIEAWKQVPNL